MLRKTINELERLIYNNILESLWPSNDTDRFIDK